MSDEQNKTKVRYYFEEVWNKGNLAVVDEVVDANVVDHNIPSVTPAGSEGQKVFVQVIHSAFPNLTLTVQDLLADGDKVIVRFSIRGTHQRDFMGIPPTGKSINVSAISIYRFEGDKCVELWTEFDQFGMMQQLGVIPVNDAATRRYSN